MILLKLTMYFCSEYLRLNNDGMDVSIRFHNYQMILDVNINKETISELNNEIAQLRVAIHNVSKHISKEYESKLI